MSAEPGDVALVRDALTPHLAPHGFQLVVKSQGQGSGGEFAEVEFVRGERRLLLWWRRDVLAVRYADGDAVLDHALYLDLLGAGDARRFPGGGDLRAKLAALAADLDACCAGFLDPGSDEIRRLAAEHARDPGRFQGLRGLGVPSAPAKVPAPMPGRSRPGHASQTAPLPGAGADRLVVQQSRAKMALVLLGSLAFVVVGLWIGITGARGEPWRVVIATYVGVPFFAGCGLFAARRLARPRPAVEIDAAGILDHSTAAGSWSIRWDEVDRVVLYPFLGQWMLGVFPQELAAWRRRQGMARRLLITLNLALGAAPMNIPQAGLAMATRELVQVLRTRYGVRVEDDG